MYQRYNIIAVTWSRNIRGVSPGFTQSDIFHVNKDKQVPVFFFDDLWAMENIVDKKLKNVLYIFIRRFISYNFLKISTVELSTRF